jgi:hypothetical protein
MKVIHIILGLFGLYCTSLIFGAMATSLQGRNHINGYKLVYLNECNKRERLHIYDVFYLDNCDSRLVCTMESNWNIFVSCFFNGIMLWTIYLLPILIFGYMMMSITDS